MKKNQIIFKIINGLILKILIETKFNKVSEAENFNPVLPTVRDHLLYFAGTGISILQ